MYLKIRIPVLVGQLWPEAGGCPCVPTPRKAAPVDKMAQMGYLLECAGINRHGVEDVRALRERNSEPHGLEFCASPVVRQAAKRKQRYRWAGY